MRPIVFLHIPKTAGQTVHHALGRMVGPENISPVRVNEQAPPGQRMPAGYRLYSGHIDWTELDGLPGDPFVFTILRDPAERMASFYLYLHGKALQMPADELAKPGHQGLKMIRESSADDYFLAGNPGWQKFVRDHYCNFYCTYLITRKFSGLAELDGLTQAEVVARAAKAAERLTAIYHVSNLTLLEQDIGVAFGRTIRVVERYQNAGNHRAGEARWPKLLALFERDSTKGILETWLEKDQALMRALALDL